MRDHELRTLGAPRGPVRRASPPVAARRPAGPPGVRTARQARCEAGDARCVVAGCRFAAISRDGFCDGHAGAYRNVRYSHPGLTPDGYLEHLARARAISAPRFDMRGLPALVGLEMGLALQARQQARRGQMTSLTFGQVTRWVLDEGVASILERGEAHWVASAQARFAHPEHSGEPVGVAAVHPPVRAAAARAARPVRSCGSGTPGRPMRSTSTAAGRTSRHGGSTSRRSSRRGCASWSSAGRAGG